MLANKKIFLELLKTFVREDWVKTIDENSLILVNKSYILQDFKEKEADIVYLLKTQDQSIIFYILLELQSTVDYLMPFRLLLYMVEVWRDVYNNTPQTERERKDFLLPPIIPAVLYNGANHWTAARTFKEIQSGYEEFAKYLLDFRYLLFDVNRYTEEELLKAANLIASVFLLDQKIGSAELVKRLHKLAAVIRNLTPDEFRYLTTWLKNVIKPKLRAEMHARVEDILAASNPWEVEKMISNLELVLEEMQQEAWLKGLEKGKLEVARNLLLLQVDVDTISKATGLNLEEIESLRKQLEH
ncbi:MAG: Rpn family recombination-promoting nuclease/putative transposase [Moorellaceae bacterium]